MRQSRLGEGVSARISGVNAPRMNTEGSRAISSSSALLMASRYVMGVCGGGEGAVQTREVRWAPPSLVRGVVSRLISHAHQPCRTTRNASGMMPLDEGHDEMQLRAFLASYHGTLRKSRNFVWRNVQLTSFVVLEFWRRLLSPSTYIDIDYR